jgi:rRNA maturation endonuclease Nob1
MKDRYSPDEIGELRCRECEISWTPDQSHACPACGTNAVEATVRTPVFTAEEGSNG